MPEQFEFFPSPNRLSVTLAARQTYRIDAISTGFLSLVSALIAMSYTFTTLWSASAEDTLAAFVSDFLDLDDWALYRRAPSGSWVVVKWWEVEGNGEIWHAANGPSITE